RLLRLTAMSEDLADELVEQITLGRGFPDLFERLYDRLRGVVPYHRIAVALLTETGDRLRLIACRSDGPGELKAGSPAPLAPSAPPPHRQAAHPQRPAGLPRRQAALRLDAADRPRGHARQPHAAAGGRRPAHRRRLLLDAPRRRLRRGPRPAAAPPGLPAGYQRREGPPHRRPGGAQPPPRRG